jgi:hypothetical protein
MDIHLDIWLRGQNHATSEVIAPVMSEPRAWTEGDVAAVLVGMLRALERSKFPDASPDRPIALRGFSWIVNPFEGGGVVIALELTLGAVVASSSGRWRPIAPPGSRRRRQRFTDRHDDPQRARGQRSGSSPRAVDRMSRASTRAMCQSCTSCAGARCATHNRSWRHRDVR